jgi:hypothetical protein
MADLGNYLLMAFQLQQELIHSNFPAIKITTVPLIHFAIDRVTVVKVSKPLFYAY